MGVGCDWKPGKPGWASCTAVNATPPVAASWPWSEDLKALDSLSLAPLNAQQTQQTQQRAKNIRIAMTVPIIEPTVEPPELVGL